MNPYSLPSFIGVALLLVFGISVILQNPRDNLSRLLCLLCLYLSILICTVGMLHLSTSEAEANFWNKWPYIFTFPGYIIMIEYAYIISGGSQGCGERILKLPMNVHRWIMCSLIVFWLIILISTDLIVAPVKFYSTTGWEHQYGPMLPAVMVTAGGYAVTLLIIIFTNGIKSATNRTDKKSRIIAFIAMVFLQGGIFIPGVILPYFFNMQSHSFVAVGFVLMCFVLTYGFMRMQWENIQDLNINLEEKIASRTDELSETNKRLKKAQEQISKYIDPNITEKIFNGEFSTELSHKRTKLTMFFSDIKDFTQFTDASDPEDVAKLLNEYLGEMAQVVRTWGGTIPQFTGDSIYAIFGAPDSKGERGDALACLRMACEMQMKMKTLREKWWNEGTQFPFEIRCGIHTGMANVGNYGSEGFMEYSAIGLNTNLASRLEQACQPGDIYIYRILRGLWLKKKYLAKRLVPLR